jgi:hypothetical protein
MISRMFLAPAIGVGAGDGVDVDDWVAPGEGLCAVGPATLALVPIGLGLTPGEDGTGEPTGLGGTAEHPSISAAVNELTIIADLFTVASPKCIHPERYQWCPPHTV